MRSDNRQNNELRPTKITLDFVSCAEGSVLIEVGKTRVLCNASVQEEVPRWMKDSGKGWITAEYSLLPRSTDTRVQRERKSVSGRTQEIQRLIGRSLRAIADLEALGERQVIVDCDVIEADGGTRTASITGAFIALGIALQKVKAAQGLKGQVLKDYVTAVSVGVLGGTPILDLCYEEDSAAEVDMNIVFASGDKLIEVQGTGEESTFTRQELNELLDLGEKGCGELMALQKTYLPELP
jgi:ribonuclease PH